ncbi:MAG: MGMT family protein [Verrucomicrobia bacterium]|nr:MGMT family protein [Verrucomicrobiota bacterium]
MTDFQKRVYAALRAVPRGAVVTYAGLARMVACGSCRAVGQALRMNPHAPRVPCHRVIASDLSIGGYQGAKDGARVRKKLALLAAEGVHFAHGRLLDPRRVLVVPTR